MSERPRAVGLLGGGVIGAGLGGALPPERRRRPPLRPEPRAAAVDEVLENARRAYAKLTLAPLPAEGSLVVCSTVEEAVTAADLVQESAPEQTWS